MSRLLHISASPRGARSESLALATTFLDSYRALPPGDTVDTFDLWDGTLAEFGPSAAAGKMTIFSGRSPAVAEAEGWARATAAFDRFDCYDR